MKWYCLIVILPVFAACKTNELYINTTRPAPVTLSPGIRKVGIINRSIPTDETRLIDVIEKIVTLEGPDLDRDGAVESVAGLAEALGQNSRFLEVRPLNGIDFRASAIGELPSPLAWDIVEKICSGEGVDALFALERFDTDTRISYSSREVDISTPLGSIPGIEHDAAMETVVKTGWRIYVPAEKSVPDEYSFAQSVVFHGRGINPAAAVEALTGRKAAVRQVSRRAGHAYASRLIPYRLRVTRDYFVKGTDNFRKARRKAQTGKWDEAGLLWEIETANPRSKIAGKAAYNMAIINEINGRLEDALAWAQKAWEDYKIRQGLSYSRILEDRLNSRELLKIQREIP